MRKGWYLGSKHHISEAICGVVHDGAHGCRYDALMIIHVLLRTDVWCTNYVQTYPGKLWSYDKIIGDQAKLSATYKSTGTCIQLAPTGPHYSLPQFRGHTSCEVGHNKEWPTSDVFDGRLISVCATAMDTSCSFSCCHSW
jgi:hypothetical protein